MRILLVLWALVMVGCVDVTARLQVDNPDVASRLEGSDCATWVLFPVMIGTVSVEGAMAKGRDLTHRDPNVAIRDLPISPIKKVHRVQVTDRSFFLAGSRCVEVFGE